MWSAPSCTQKSQCPTALRFTSSTFIFALRALSLFPDKSETTNRVSSRAWAEGQFVAAQKREGQALEARLFIERLFDNEPQCAHRRVRRS